MKERLRIDSKDLLHLFISATFFIFIPHSSASKPALHWKENQAQTLRKYNRFLKSVSKKFCSQGEDHQYDSLYENFKGGGYYVPQLSNSEIDKDTIKMQLPEIIKKLAWIEKAKADTEKQNFPSYDKISTPLVNQMERLLELKKEFHLGQFQNLEDLKKRNTAEIRKLKQIFDEFTKNIPFLLNYRFPVDHEKNRIAYEKVKDRENKKRTLSANAIYFLRKITEDGAQDSDHRRSDVYLRTALDTATLTLKNHPETFLSEDLRFDLQWILKKIKNLLLRGKRNQIERLTEWENRTRQTFHFYSGLLGNAAWDVGWDVKRYVQSREKLRDFVLNQHAKIYQYVSKQPEMIRSLFALDKILANEVGPATTENLLDRRDVAQVVINRRYHPAYSKIPKDEVLLSYLPKSIRKNTANFPWLNTLFKEGEFSFTYYYIPSVVRVFCANQSPWGQKNRNQNLRLAIDTLRNPNWSFKALKYFSRISMTGKVDMSQIWTNYREINERPGLPIRSGKSLIKRLKKNQYQYLYPFISAGRNRFDVIEINNQAYSVLNLTKNPKFFQHRNPQEFTFFTK